MDEDNLPKEVLSRKVKLGKIKGIEESIELKQNVKENFITLINNLFLRYLLRYFCRKIYYNNRVILILTKF